MNKLIRLIKKLEGLGFSEEPHYQEYIEDLQAIDKPD